MAFADGNTVMERIEALVKSIYQKFAEPGTTIESPLSNEQFTRMTYADAMSKYGSDKPDLRIQGVVSFSTDFADRKLITLDPSH